MLLESVMILILLIVISYVYHVRGRIAIPVLAVPLAILPAVRIITYMLSSVEQNITLLHGIYITATILAIIFMMLLSSKIENKKFRVTYITVSCVYFIVYTALRGMAIFKNIP